SRAELQSDPGIPKHGAQVIGGWRERTGLARRGEYGIVKQLVSRALNELHAQNFAGAADEKQDLRAKMKAFLGGDGVGNVVVAMNLRRDQSPVALAFRGRRIALRVAVQLPLQLPDASALRGPTEGPEELLAPLRFAGFTVPLGRGLGFGRFGVG